MTDPIKDAAAELRRRIEEKVGVFRSSPEMAEVITLQQSLNALEDVLHEPRSTLAEFFGLPVSASSLSPSPALPTVRFDEFYGMSDLAAAKAYLKKRSEARPFEEIVTAIKTGGGKVDSEEKLRTGLSRSTFDIVKIGERYGHIDSYPDERAKRFRGLRKGSAADDKDDKKDDAPTTTP